MASLAERGRERRLERPGGHETVQAGPGLADCDDCGKVERIPGTHLLAVTTEYCEDACHLHVGLYDPRMAEFVDPARNARQKEPFPWGTLDDAWVCAGGAVFVTREGRAVRFSGGSFDAGGASGIGGGGCLDGGWFYPRPED
ncbi:MAG: hypothetical protein D6705_09485 [Deltaproteobacteria bacterium]|nr:MAG: hypothetical protein D6705_09485 [Deltaproteobacteria bacterium]